MLSHQVIQVFYHSHILWMVFLSGCFRGATSGLNENRNYTFVDVSFSYKYFSDEKQDDETYYMQEYISKWDFPSQFSAYFDIGRKQLLSEAHLQFLRRVEKERIKFDLIIVEMFFVPFGCVLSRTYSGSAPIISLHSISTEFLVENNIGSIAHLSFAPSVYNDYTDKMSLWQRIENWFSNYYLWSLFEQAEETVVKRYCNEMYGPGSEKLADGCWSNVSLALVANNPVYYYPRALSPNVIEVGPLHLKTPEKLSKELQDWLDGAERGVIYFSLGSNIKSKSLPPEVRSNFINFFAEHPDYRVLWKWELDGKIPSQSNNILAQKWMPQTSILAHPKVKVYITQGGLQSFQEAVHYGVPLVGIPWSGDQGCNVAKMVDAGIGVRLRPQDLHSYDNIKAALETVLFDARFFENMKKLSALSKDFTDRGMDQAVFWIEHVAKHGGASHLRPATADTTLFQYFCLDIISLVLTLLIFCTYIVVISCKFVVAVVFKESLPKIKAS
nr:PREDICTED: UDP-glucuronosyltransferase 2B7-like isoform X2 [Bemisia tabaci]